MQPHQRVFVAISSILLFSGAAYYLVPVWFANDLDPLASIASSFKAPRQNLWADLSPSEATDIYAFLYRDYPELNLTRKLHTGFENHINFVELLRPNKTEALPYIADEAAYPQRWAKAAITETFNNETYITYYSVGPLPISDKSQMLPLDHVFNSGRNHVKNPVPEFLRLQQWGAALASNLSDITLELLGAAVNFEDEKDPNGLAFSSRRVWTENGQSTSWIQFTRPGVKNNAWSVLPQGLYFKLNTTATELDTWKILEWYYNGIFYGTAEELRSAMREPDFVSAPVNYDGHWTDVEDLDAKPSGRDMAPPVMVQPYGPRYKLDRKQNYISWMGFEMFVSTAQSTGPALFDIRFNGDRIMYELGLQEAMAHYAGDDPMQGGQEFLDTFYGMGKMTFELVQGYDCPAYADYISSTYHQTEAAITTPNNICVFEYTADHALQRHTSEFHVSISRNTYLVLRSVSTVGNYDYTVDYIFYLDGTIEVKVRASGFIFAAFYSANATKHEGKYGYRIHDAAATSMHDHVINFKADLDIAGTHNDFVRIGIEPTTRSYPWEQPEVPVRNTMQLVERPVVAETGLDWPKNAGEMLAVYHATATNAWGERRGYRIVPGTGMGTPPHLTIHNSTSLGRSARWAEHDVWVLRRKDTEPKSCDALNFLEPLDPLVDFEKMADGESLLVGAAGAGEHGDDAFDGDLVVYFNLGAHHVPHSGDIPNTLMHTSASSVMFVPHNFADRDPSRATVQGVRLDTKGMSGGDWVAGAGAGAGGDLRPRGGKRDVETQKAKTNYFGKTYDKGVKLALEDLEPDLTKYDPKRREMTDLSFNGSLLGIWVQDAA